MIKKGTDVKWEWGEGFAKGSVVETFHEDVKRTIDGNEVKREASEDNPAYLIKQNDGQKVLKSKSEIIWIF